METTSIETQSFKSFNLEPELQAALDKANFLNATPVQSQVLPLALQGKDISGLAQTGTGKTGAFVIPLINRIIKARKYDELQNHSEEEIQIIKQNSFYPWKKREFCLVLVPTRELVDQVTEQIHLFGKDCDIKAISIYGGVEYESQKADLLKGVEFIVATPGRFIDLYKNNLIDLKQVRAVVFDEADRMFDMGFKDDMNFLLQRMPSDRQFLVFSATINFEVLTTAYRYGANPIECHISKDELRANNVVDQICHVGSEEKPMYLLSLLKKMNAKQIIIFSNYKYQVERIARFLSDNEFPALGISSLLNQNQRNRVIEQFKAENQKNILVATDVAARGLDIKGVDLVINFDLPDDAENYVHRIGRTGRAGEKGVAYSLVSDTDVESLGRIETLLKNKLAVVWLEDAELIQEFKPMSQEYRVREHSDKKPQDRKSQDFRGGGANDKRGNRDRKAFNKEAKPNISKPGQSEEALRSKPNISRPEAKKPEGFEHKKSSKNKKNHKWDKSKNKNAGGAKALSRPQPVRKESKLKKFFKTIFGMK